jgi:hypothetical protein
MSARTDLAAVSTATWTSLWSLVPRRVIASGGQLVELVDPDGSLLNELAIRGAYEGDRWCVG